MIDNVKTDIETFIKFICRLYGNEWYENLSIELVDLPGGKRLVLKHNNPKENNTNWYLRFSAGPRQGYFWDMYGEDLQSYEMVLWILCQKLPRPPGSKFK